MNGVELNLRRRWNLRTQRYHYAATSFLVGIRYLNVDEQFRYYTESDVPTGAGSINDINIRTENDLLVLSSAGSANSWYTVVAGWTSRSRAESSTTEGR